MCDKFVKAIVPASILSFLSIGCVFSASAELTPLKPYVWNDNYGWSDRYSALVYSEYLKRELGVGNVVFFDENKRATDNLKSIVYYSSLSDIINSIDDGSHLYIDKERNVITDNRDDKRYSVKQVVTDLYSDNLIGRNSDGTLTDTEGATTKITVKNGILELSARTNQIDAAVAKNSADIQSKTLVGENSDGTLTRADGAGKTISVNDGLVKLSGRTDKIDAAVGAIDGRVTNNTQSIGENSKTIASVNEGLGKLTGRTDKIDAAVGAIDGRVTNNTQSIGENSKTIASVNDGLGKLTGRTDKIDAAVGDIDGRVTNNTQSINKNNKAIASNTRTLQQHSARLDKQQRQINENHKEMKRAAAQSAALTGLFQPYSVGKFNATAAVGGYSDQQAMAVGVGYRFNEQTAAKAGVAFSDGDASWNVGVNFEF
ncbi:YadA C-terminal domain-containing protein [Escherichia coli]|uniref:YadA C-terminal domain-containing protein n=1 Tax=Escherichia coli TaxID=562 RepID=UPI000B7E6935|nr:YadA-like family protein [Escherichia coli]